jgi:hypothetical protein
MVVLVHEVSSLAELEALWRFELSRERLTVASDTPVESGKQVTIRLEMPGPQLWLSGTVRSVRPAGDRFTVELDLVIRGVQMETLRKLAES